MIVPGRNSRSKGRVAVVRCDYTNIYQSLKKAINLAGGMDLSSYDRILLKINSCEFRTPETGAVTHPLLVDALLRILREEFAGKKVHLVESDATTTDADLFFGWLGYREIADRHGAECVNLTKEDAVKMRISGRYIKEMPIPRIFDGSYLITLPKMKTHQKLKVSLSLKNQFGCIPYKWKYKYHKRLDDAIVDANLSFPADFCIVDGIIGMEGINGPGFGRPIAAKTLVVGNNAVSVDAACSRIMGFNPMFIGHIRKSADSGLGSMRYELVGNDVSLKFDFNSLHAMFLRVASAMVHLADKTGHRVSARSE